MAKEVVQNRERLVECASGSRAPLVIEEVFKAFGADRRFKVGEIEVREVPGELVERALIVAIRRFRQAASLRSQVVAGAEAQWEGAIRLVLHRLAPESSHL